MIRNYVSVLVRHFFDNEPEAFLASFTELPGIIQILSAATKKGHPVRLRKGQDFRFIVLRGTDGW